MSWKKSGTSNMYRAPKSCPGGGGGVGVLYMGGTGPYAELALVTFPGPSSYE